MCPGSTVNSMRFFLQDISRYLRDYYREKKMEREILTRDATVEQEQLYSKELARASSRHGPTP